MCCARDWRHRRGSALTTPVRAMPGRMVFARRLVMSGSPGSAPGGGCGCDVEVREAVKCPRQKSASHWSRLAKGVIIAESFIGRLFFFGYPAIGHAVEPLPRPSAAAACWASCLEWLAAETRSMVRYSSIRNLMQPRSPPISSGFGARQRSMRRQIDPCEVGPGILTGLLSGLKQSRGPLGFAMDNSVVRSQHRQKKMGKDRT